MDTAELLRRFVKDRSEDDFAELVARHVNLVYSAALRQVRDAALADDVAQMAFVTLARRAGDLKPGVPLDAWLLKVTYYAACDARRRRDRRSRHERRAAAMKDTVIDQTADDQWEQIAEHLDQELAELRETERNLISLRFMRGLPMKEVAAAVGMSENTAGKRISRVLEKLRARLTRRGVTVPAAAFAALLGIRAIGPAPSALAGTIARTALSSAHPGVSIGIAQWLTTTGAPAKAAIFILAMLLMAGIAISAGLRRGGTVGAPPAAGEAAAPAGLPSALPSKPTSAPANLVFVKHALPRATYFADVSRTVFPAGLFKEADTNGRPRGWDDLSAFDTGNAQRFTDVRQWLRLTNDDPTQTVSVRALVPLLPQWKTLAVLARFRQSDLVISDTGDAGAGIAFVDSAAKQVAGGIFLTPYVGTNFPAHRYTKAVGATLTVPANAAYLVVCIEVSRATGLMEAGNIVVMPVDPLRDADPAQVIALHSAINNGNVERAKQMIKSDRRLLECRNLDYNGGTPLTGAAWRDRADVISALLGMGADVHARDVTAVWRQDGWTATEWAAYWGSLNALKVLIAGTDEMPQEVLQFANSGQGTHRNQPPKFGHPEDYAGCIDLLTTAATTRPTTMPIDNPVKEIFKAIKDAAEGG